MQQQHNEGGVIRGDMQQQSNRQEMRSAEQNQRESPNNFQNDRGVDMRQQQHNEGGVIRGDIQQQSNRQEMRSEEQDQREYPNNFQSQDQRESPRTEAVGRQNQESAPQSNNNHAPKVSVKGRVSNNKIIKWLIMTIASGAIAGGGLLIWVIYGDNTLSLGNLIDHLDIIGALIAIIGAIMFIALLMYALIKFLGRFNVKFDVDYDADWDWGD